MSGFFSSCSVVGCGGVFFVFLCVFVFFVCVCLLCFFVVVCLEVRCSFKTET